VDGLIVWWSRQKKWWKAFYVTFVVAFIMLLVIRAHPFAAFQVAALWAIMVAGAIWASEKLKDRLRRRRERR